MNIFMLGLRVTDTAREQEGLVDLITEALPSSDKKIPTKVQLLDKPGTYVANQLKKFQEGDHILAIGPTKPIADGEGLKMKPMMVVTKENFDDILVMNMFMATGGLGPKADEVQLGDNTVTNRSIAWQDEDKETQWFKLTAWGEKSKQLSELPPGTPTVAVGKVSCSSKEDKQFLNYSVDKVLYLPRGTKPTPKKASDPDKGKVAGSALGTVDFDF
tara:strand:- start:18187 stop:18834 length:648 start_codon:yes stop_codon:yes gene_type:complete